MEFVTPPPIRRLQREDTPAAQQVAPAPATSSNGHDPAASNGFSGARNRRI
jgi:hypothetical protein